MWDRWLAGLELNADWYTGYEQRDFEMTAAGAVATDTVLYTGLVEFEREATLGLSARLGYQVVRCLIPYIRLGVEVSRDKLDVSYVGPRGVVGLGDQSFIADISDRDTSVRWVGGVGVEMPLTNFRALFMDNASVRLEYDYHSKGGSLDGSVFRSDAFGVAPFTDQIYTTHYKPHTNTVKLSLAWNFG
jgi:opacity protein-like surface antigen